MLLGVGQFGKVYRGWAILDEAGCCFTKVAIKKPRGIALYSTYITILQCPVNMLRKKKSVYVSPLVQFGANNFYPVYQVLETW